MGNQLSQNYDIKQQITRVGPASCWVVKAAVVRKTEKPCALFIWTKKEVEEGAGIGNAFGFGKDKVQLQKELLWFENTLVFEVKQLSKLRFPNILKVMDPLVTNDHFLAFSSEPIVWNLHDLLVSHSNPTTTPTILHDSDSHLDDVDIQEGLIQICKALDFLHKNEILHLCLSPECIFIDEKGDWKLAGFTYSRKLGKNCSIDTLPYTMPSLAYLAPEILLGKEATILSDTFSFGSLIYSIFNSSKSFTNATEVSLYIEKVKKGVNISMIPLSLQPKVKEMLSFDTTFRPDLQMLLTSDYFNNNLIGTLKTIAGLIETSPVEKARFLKQLPTLLQQFSLKTVVKKVLPCLLEELKNPEVAVFVLPNLFWIGERLTADEFTVKILPSLRSNVWFERDPPLVILLLLSRIDLLARKVIESEFESVDELLCRSLASKNGQVSIAACKAIPLAAPKITKKFLVASLIPQLTILFQDCKSIQIQGYCLISLRSLIPTLGKDADGEEMILKSIFRPLLDRLTQVPEELILLVAVIYHDCGIYHFSAAMNSMKSLPALWRLSSFCKTRKQYKFVMNYIDEVGKKVREEKLTILSDISEKVELAMLAEKKNATPYSKESLIPFTVGATPSSSPHKPLVDNTTASFFAKLDQQLSRPSSTLNSNINGSTDGSISTNSFPSSTIYSNINGNTTGSGSNNSFNQNTAFVNTTPIYEINQSRSVMIPTQTGTTVPHLSSTSGVAKKLDWSEFDPCKIEFF